MSPIRHCLAAVAALGLAWVSLCAAADIEAAIDAARSLRLQGQPTESARALQGIVVEHPEHFRAAYNLGLAFAATGDDEHALEAFATASRLRDEQNGRDGSIHNTYGWQLLRMGRLEAALAQFEKGLALQDLLTDASRSRLLNNYGLALLQAGRYDQAEAMFTRAGRDYGNPLAARNIELARAARDSESTEWTLVFGADRTQEAAAYEVQNARAAGIGNAGLVLRDGMYRSVAVYDGRQQAEAALEKAQLLRSDSYLVRMDRWCPQTTEQGELKVCSDSKMTNAVGSNNGN